MSVDYNIASAATGALAVFFTGWMATHQRRTEIKSTRETLLIDQLQEEASRLRIIAENREQSAQKQYKQIQSLRDEIAELRHGLHVLSGQLRELGLEPEWPIKKETA